MKMLASRGRPIREDGLIREGIKRAAPKRINGKEEEEDARSGIQEGEEEEVQMRMERENKLLRKDWNGGRRMQQAKKKKQQTPRADGDDALQRPHKKQKNRRKQQNLMRVEEKMKDLWNRIVTTAISMAKTTSFCFGFVPSSNNNKANNNSVGSRFRDYHHPRRLMFAKTPNFYRRLNPPVVNHDEDDDAHNPATRRLRHDQSFSSATTSSSNSSSSSSSDASAASCASIAGDLPPPSIVFLKPPTSSPASAASDEPLLPFFFDAFAEHHFQDHGSPPLHPSRRLLPHLQQLQVADPQRQLLADHQQSADELYSFRMESSASAFASHGLDADDTVVLKIGLLGDSETGKTSFMAKYVSAKQGNEYVETIGVASVEKVFRLRNVNIAMSIWDLGAHWQSSSMLPMVCADAAAIFIMFDLTRRSTLQSVKDWFLQARSCNKAAIPVIIGTKYDQFVELPHDIQFAIIQQARFYAKAMEAALFFSSVTHNINVHKIFKIKKLCPVPTFVSADNPTYYISNECVCSLSWLPLSPSVCSLIIQRITTRLDGILRPNTLLEWIFLWFRFSEDRNLHTIMGFLTVPRIM